MKQFDIYKYKNTSKDNVSPYLYQDSGIIEHPGRVPVWLYFVIIGLLVWGVYYLLEFWSQP